MSNQDNNLDIQTESDVEQKLVLPLLVSPIPQGLGFSVVHIKTKPDIRRFLIGKGREAKLYYPDYLVVLSGLPMLIVEAKAPGESLVNAYREARLYATELNSNFPTSLNPAARIICTNGEEIIAGYWDSDTPKITLRYNQLYPADPVFAELINFIGIKTLSVDSINLLEKLTKRPFYKPTRLIGGQSVRNEEIGHNSFGATLSLDYRHLFNPSSREERAYIARNAYISSRRREQYVQPIDKIIRAAAPPSESDAVAIENTQHPNELINVLRKTKSIEQQVLLLIGNVGSGKSTFVDYLREVALPEDIKGTTLWVHTNMNNAPLNAQQIYDWLLIQIIEELRKIYPEYDFDDLKEIEKLYSVELNRLKRGALQLLTPGSADYNSRLADEIIRLQNDKHLSAGAFIRYLGAERGKLLIVVLDNCDKRVRDEQLLMFQAAQWLQQQFRCLIILPLRDETYDNHRNEPPLDTALKDLVFRIEPPLFHRVLVKRISLALSEMNGKKELSYVLPNGMRVEYPANEQAYYLSTILRSIFEYNRFLRGVIVGLAGRDLRRAMEIFLEFCTSGHIGTDEIFKIRQAKGNYVLPYHVVAQVLLRRSRRFYDGGGDYAYVKNIFSCMPEDPRPIYFTRFAILKWLEKRRKIKGASGITGYHPVRELKSDIIPLGISESIINREILFLLKARCVVAEHLRVDAILDEDLIKLAPAGFVHLDLVSNVEYLAAVSEDTWFDKENTARAISERITQDDHYQFGTTVKNAQSFLDYLVEKTSEPFPSPNTYLENKDWEYLIDVGNAIAKLKKIDAEIRQDPWFTVEERYRIGQIIEGKIVNYNDHGVFIEIEPEIVGLVHQRYISKINQKEIPVMIGKMVRVKIIWLDSKKRRMGLDLTTENDIKT